MNNPITKVISLTEKVRAHIGTDDPGPQTDDPVEIAHYWIERYFEWHGYTFYSAAKASMPAMAKLAERGWGRRWRVPGMVDTNRRPPMPAKDPLARDPVAKAIREVYIDETLVKTPKELLEDVEGEARRRQPGLAPPPADAGGLHGHLLRITPALQMRRLFVDREEADYYSCLLGRLPKDPRKYCRYGYVRTEYWQNARSGDALWVFTAFRSGRREIEGAAVPSVWERVKGFEKVAEHLEEPLMHRRAEDEDSEVRKAVEELSCVDRWAEPGEWA